MNHKYKSLNATDDILILNLKNFFTKMELKNPPSIEATMFGQRLTLSFNMVFSTNSYVDNLRFAIPLIKVNNLKTNFAINRNGLLLDITISTNQETALNSDDLFNLEALLNIWKELFKEFNDIEYITRNLNADLADLYTTREASLGKIEQLSYKITENYEDYRRKTEQDYSQKVTELENNYQIKKSELEQSYQAKMIQLESEKKQLEEFKKEIDDRSNTHARREIRQQLLKTIKERYQSFTLSGKTVGKRLILHVLFIFFLVSISSILIFFIFKHTETLSSYMKIGLSTLGFAATMLYYIRWNDSWFRKHAEEEFFMKRFELDIERASWLVEMAMEWKNEKGSEIPTELIQKLSTNLFNNKAFDKVTHPTEDVIDGILKGLASLNLNLPGVGSIELNKKAAKGISKALTGGN